MNRNLFAAPIRRAGSDGRPASLLHAPADPRQRRRQTTTTRLNDGLLWTRAAWAEVLGLEPVVRWHTTRGEAREARPWADGATSAMAYLHEAAKHSGLARKYLADIARRDREREALR